MLGAAVFNSCNWKQQKTGFSGFCRQLYIAGQGGYSHSDQMLKKTIFKNIHNMRYYNTDNKAISQQYQQTGIRDQYMQATAVDN